MDEKELRQKENVLMQTEIGLYLIFVDMVVTKNDKVQKRIDAENKNITEFICQ